MPSISRGNGRAGGRGRGRGRGARGRGGLRSGRNENKKNTFESARIVEDQEIMLFPPASNSEDEPSSPGDSSSDEDGAADRPRAYNVLLQSFGQAQENREPSQKRRRIEGDFDRNVTLQKSNVSEEEGEEQATDAEEEVVEDQDIQDGPDDDEDASDPYEAHFVNPEDNQLSLKLKAVAENHWLAEPLPKTAHPYTAYNPNIGIEVTAFNPPVPSVKSVNIKKKLCLPAEAIFPALEGIQLPLGTNMFAFRDVVFGARTVADAQILRSLTCLHALNLVFKTRDRILKNNARLAKEEANLDLEYRDQGFTRPKVLVLLPTRHSCVRFIDTLVNIAGPEQQENKKRFEDGFGEPVETHTNDQPEDHRELMEGNTDDMFRLGIKFTRKTMKYFSQFYNSDIIFASPLGLRRALDSNDSKKQDFDFLSSIELVIVDQTDALLMQNWQHVEYIFEHLNLQPREAHGCDFSRVRNWYLDGNAKYLRQTIVMSAYITPELKALFSKHMNNVAGKVLFQPQYPGAMLDLGIQIKQTFSRFTPTSIATDPDERFKYFTTAIIPSLTRYPKPPDGCLGVLIFIPSYFDFVRVRNYFANSSATQNVSFGSISENSSPADREIRRARSHFLTGKHSVLLYTGRAHHFFRYKIRGVKKVIMYGLPENPIYYREIVGGYLGASISDGKIGLGEASVRILFSRYDRLKLERVVGSERFGRLLGDGAGGDTFDFL